MKITENNKGMALLITLGVITVLIAGAVELNRRARAAVIMAAAGRDKIALTQMAYSAIQAGMLMLIKDKKTSVVDSIQEDWANPEKITEVLADIPFDAGKVSLSIEDELGKIQVNALVDFPKGRHFNESQKIMWDRLLRLIISGNEDLKDVEPAAIINSIKDWLDSGDDDATTGLNGAEAEYYEGLDPPYKPKNGPFTHIEELALVKDINPELFHGIKKIPGLENYITVYGMTKSKRSVDGKNFTFEGKININTAELPVLIAMMPSENTDYAQSIYDYRNEKENDVFIHDLSNPTWYKNAPDIPSDFKIDPKLITTKSDFFTIKSTAELNDSKITLLVTIHRERQKKTGKWMCKIISWQEE